MCRWSFHLRMNRLDFSRSIDLVDLRHRELSISSVGNEPHFVTRLDFPEQLRIQNVEDHRHSFVHAKLLDRPMLDRDLLSRRINFCYLAYLCVRQLGESREPCCVKRQHQRNHGRGNYSFHGEHAFSFADPISFDDNLTDHSGLAMAWNKAREFESSLFAEAPQNF